jgi:hypothetical protein
VVLPALTYVASVGKLTHSRRSAAYTDPRLSVMGLLQMLWIDVFPGWKIDYSVAWISLTAAVNALITATISFRLLVTYYKNKEYLPSTSSQVYLSVIAILVEAALPLAILGIILACFISESRGAGASKPHQGIFRILYFFFLVREPWRRVVESTPTDECLRPYPPR